MRRSLPKFGSGGTGFFVVLVAALPAVLLTAWMISAGQIKYAIAPVAAVVGIAIASHEQALTLVRGCLLFGWAAVALCSGSSIFNNEIQVVAFGFLGMSAFVSALARKGRFAARSKSVPSRLFLLYGCWLGFTTLLAFSPVEIFRWAEGFIALTAMLASVRIGITGFQILRSLAIAAGIHVVLALIGVQNQDVGIALAGRLSGDLHPNSLGFAAALLALYGLWIILHRRGFVFWVGGAFTALALAALLGSKSRTSLAGVVVGVVFILVRERRAATRGLSRRSIVTFTIAASVILGLGFGASDVAQLVTRSNTLKSQEQSTLRGFNGRTDIWARIVTAIEQRPLTGYGVGASEKDGLLSDLVHFRYAATQTTHNALLEATAAGGIPGGILWLVAMIALLVAIARARQDLSALCLGIWFLLAITAVTEALPAWFSLQWFSVLMLTAMVTGPGARRAPAVSAAPDAIGAPESAPARLVVAR
jgi:O-antigen ligase